MLQELVDRIGSESKTYGQYHNETKTSAITSNGKKVNGKNLEQGHKFTYLGAVIGSDEKLNEEENIEK